MCVRVCVCACVCEFDTREKESLTKCAFKEGLELVKGRKVKKNELLEWLWQNLKTHFTPPPSHRWQLATQDFPSQLLLQLFSLRTSEAATFSQKRLKF